MKKLISIGLFVIGLGVSFNGCINPVDPINLAKLNAKECYSGNAKKCTSLGSMYYNGEGVQKNTIQAAKYYKKACDGEDARGCYNLGVLYHHGFVIFVAKRFLKQDHSKALKYYKKACDGGFDAGCESYQVLHKW